MTERRDAGPDRSGLRVAILALAMAGGVALSACGGNLQDRRGDSQLIPPSAIFAPSAPPVPPSALPPRSVDPSAGQTDGQIGQQPRAVQSLMPPVALLLPLSGRQGELGQAMLDAAQLALFDVADQNFRMIVEDTGGTPQGAQAAAQRALNQGAGLILGPLLSSSVRAVAPQAQVAGVTVISFTTDRTVAGGGVYTMGFLPRAEVDRVVRYVIQQGRSRFGILAPRTPYGETVVQEMNRSVSQFGGTITAAAFYDPSARDYSDVVRSFARYDERVAQLESQRRQLSGRTDEISQQALKELENRTTAGDLPFDALMVPDGGRRLLAVLPLLPFYDVDPKVVQFLGTGLWDEQESAAEPAVRAGWYAAPAPETRAAFEARYLETYGREPPRLATLAYDSMALSAVLARQFGPNGFQEQYVASPSGFAGLDGIFRFLPNGLVHRSLAILRLERTGAVVVHPPLTTFENVGQ